MIILWFFLSLMLLTALLFALAPFLKTTRSSLDLDQSSLQQELHHLKTEFSQGLINQKNLEQAQYELALNFINEPVRKIEPIKKAVSRKRIEIITLIVILLLIPLVSLSFYFKWGASNLLSQYYVLEKNKDVKNQLSKLSVQQLIDKMNIIMANRPTDPQGWYLLGRLYQSQNDYPNALIAFNKAHQLKPDDVNISIQLAQLMFFLNKNQLNNQAKQLIDDVLKSQGQNPMAINLLALDAYQHQQYQQALDYWEKILPMFSTQSQEGQIILKSIHEAQLKIK